MTRERTNRSRLAGLGRAFASFALLALLLAACGRPADERAKHETAPGEPAPAANVIAVELVDHEIRMPDTIPAGSTEFRVRNMGDHEHNFEIEGQGIEKELENNLKSAESGILRLDLRPGTYRVYCPVGDHANRGMSKQITVQ